MCLMSIFKVHVVLVQHVNKADVTSLGQQRDVLGSAYLQDFFSHDDIVKAALDINRWVCALAASHLRQNVKT